MSSIVLLFIIVLTSLVTFSQIFTFISFPEENKDILIPPSLSKEGPLRALILVPGGLVPNNNYALIADSIMEQTSFKLWVAIPHCLANLCDPLDTTSFGLNSAIFRVINMINSTTSGSLFRENIFIFGHSLGGTGARHFIDLYPNFAGLGLLGTQYIGDHEDFKGTLGYPSNLSTFPIPLLAVTGELDSIPFTHAARMFEQRNSFTEEEKMKKVIVVVRKMDHSDFCPGFHVKGDIMTELSSDDSVRIIGEIISSWLELQVRNPNSEMFLKAKDVIENYVEESKGLFSAFLNAISLDEKEWCAFSQQIISGLDENQWDKLNINGVFIEGPTFNLVNAHPKYTFEDQILTINVPSCPYYEEIKDFSYATLYSGARDIACKMVSAERIASILNVKVSIQKTCKDINEKSFDLAKQLLQSSHPESLSRFEKQGTQPEFKNDSFTHTGPQWVFLSSLDLDAATGQITSPDMYTSLDSIIYPGVRYCKVLSPARAVEFIMTTSLKNRYS